MAAPHATGASLKAAGDFSIGAGWELAGELRSELLVDCDMIGPVRSESEVRSTDRERRQREADKLAVMIAVGDGRVASIEEGKAIKECVEYQSACEDRIVMCQPLRVDLASFLTGVVLEHLLRQFAGRFPFGEDDETPAGNGTDRAGKVGIDNVDLMDCGVAGCCHRADNLPLGVSVAT